MTRARSKPLLAVVALLLVSLASSSAGPSRLSMDFSSSLIVSPDSTPASVSSRLDALLRDMYQDGVNTLCNGRLTAHICDSTSTSSTVSLRSPLLQRGDDSSATDACTLCAPAAAAATTGNESSTDVCICKAPGGTTRCTCAGKLSGEQYFNAKWYGLELARVLVEAVGETKTIEGGINANFNSTIRLRDSKVFVSKGAGGDEGIHDLELDESHLDILDGSELHIEDDGDLEVEDAGTLWLSGQSKLIAKQASNIQTQLTHILVEGGSSIVVEANSEWNVTQEFDFTPVQATAVCNKPFEPNTAAELCFDGKDGCTARLASKQLSGPEHQALGMLQYPPALDRWGRQAFDYADDDVYDDYYDADYTEIPLDVGTCLGPDVCDTTATIAAAVVAKMNSFIQTGHRRTLLAEASMPILASTFSKPTDPVAAATTAPAAAATSVSAAQSIATAKAVDATAQAAAPAHMSTETVPATTGDDTTNTDKANEADDNTDKDSKDSTTAEDDDKSGDTTDGNNRDTSDSGDSNTAQNDGDANVSSDAASSSSSAGVVSDGDDEGTATTEINAKDTLDGTGYDPEWGEGPYGESLCDAPPFKAFNYYGIVIRDGSHVRIASQSTWTLFDQSRVFIKDSRLTLEDGAKLNLYNSTIVLINSVLEIRGSSEIRMERFSGLHLFQSKVLGDNALFAVPAGSTWNGQPWIQRGDYRASPGGGLPLSMGVQPGAQIGSYPMRVFGFDMDARLMPAAGCSCKKPRTNAMPAAAAVVNVPSSGNLLENLI